MRTAAGELAGAAAAPRQGAVLSRPRAIAASTIGNVLEWYDFAVYGYFATAIGAAFFPADDPVASTLAAFGVFAAGFAARPIGGMVFGHIGDRLGRKRALTLSIALMAVPTVLIGLLPGHAQIGALAAALLVVLRIAQGLSVGGEYTTSIVYIVEHAAPERRGALGSAAMVGATTGILLGSAVGALVSSLLDAASIVAWGWRLPFLMGILVGILGIVLRRRLPEVPIPAAARSGRAPLVEALQTEWRTILRCTFLCLMAGPVFYLTFVYVVSYLQTLVHVPGGEALEINTLSMLGLLGFVVLGGALSDRLGRRPVAVVSALALLVLAWPLFRFFHHPSWIVMLPTQLAFAALIGLYIGQLPATLVEALPARVRCSGLSLSYNVCVGLCGGFAPLLATWLVHRTGDDMAPAAILIAVAALMLGALWSSRETAGQPLR